MNRTSSASISSASIRCLNLDVTVSKTMDANTNMNINMGMTMTRSTSQEHNRNNPNIPRSERCLDLSALCLAERNHIPYPNPASPAKFCKSMSSWSDYHINNFTNTLCSTSSSSCSTPISSTYGRQRSIDSVYDHGNYDFVPCPTPVFNEDDLQAQMLGLGHGDRHGHELVVREETYERPAKRMCLNTRG
mmetsp:Transcript_18303/g.31708  ORF Transcript_18303/g.31708 Transcript_18303/m.31708 type:complete len:190 (+) Transcript_18303:206-775(+)